MFGRLVGASAPEGDDWNHSDKWFNSEADARDMEERKQQQVDELEKMGMQPKVSETPFQLPPLPDASFDPGVMGGGMAPLSEPPPTSSLVEKFADGITMGNVKSLVGDFAVPEKEAFGEAVVLEETDIKVHTLDVLRLGPQMAKEVSDAWQDFLQSGDSPEVAGEAIYSALFEAAPSLQSLFLTARAVQAMRFMNGLNSFVASVHNPPNLKVLVETLGFGHLHLEVTVPRVVLFRDAILELLKVELQHKFSDVAAEGWRALLNYVGGAIIFVKSHYAERLQILASSWIVARGEKGQGGQLAQAVENMRLKQGQQEENMGEDGSGEGGDDDAIQDQTAKSPKSFKFWKKDKQDANSNTPKSKSTVGNGQTSPRGDGSGELDAAAIAKKAATKTSTTYNEMFTFNMAVMGMQKSQKWLMEITTSFDTIVSNIQNSARLSQECEVLALKLSKIMGGNDNSINLGEYKSCMLSSMRGVLAKVWDSNYEVAWNWLWDNVERLLRRTLGKPRIWEQVLNKMMGAWPEDQIFEVRKSIYEHFFAAAPIGQDYFKQSNTRLHYIADRVLQMTCELFQDPWKMVDNLSALGLRHVGYSIPTELFGPFVTACIQVISGVTTSQEALEGFRWALGLISQILVGTINEGSTIVMKAINENSVKMLKKAISCAPRGQRAQWLLLVQVGTQSISPLSWALESGSTDTAAAIIEDLLNIRADRERYYYGMEELFVRHTDIVAILCKESTELLFVLLEGLVWRSRLTANSLRRANYYVKYLIVDAEGKFSNALDCLTKTQNPEVMSNDVVNIVSDKLWESVVCWNFIYSRIWFVVSLIVFMLAQAILPKFADPSLGVRSAIFACRVFNYIGTLCRLLIVYSRDIYQAYRDHETKRIGGIPVPAYLLDGHELGTFVLGMLFFAMVWNEPMFYCLGDPAWPTEDCPKSEGVWLSYSLFAMWAMILHWVLLVDLAVFSTGLSAFALVCMHVASEIGRFLIALGFCLLTFASAISVLQHSYEAMQTVQGCFVTLFAITLQIYEDDYRDFQEDKMLLGMVFFFIMASAILLLNLLIAQLNCSYVYVYKNMFGFARMRRAEVIVEQLNENTPEVQWRRAVDSYGLTDRLEFNAGDVGIAGGMTVDEPAAEHTVAKDRVLRFGGTCSPEANWPEEIVVHKEDDTTKFERMERLIQKTLKKLATTGSSRRARGSKRDASHNNSSGHSGSSKSSGSLGSEMTGGSD